MDLKDLLRDLAGLDEMLWVIGGAEAVSENSSRGMEEPTFSGGYANLEADNWHVHLKLDDVAGVQFVEAEDHVAPYLYYVRFSNKAEETLFRVYFPNPYLDDNFNPVEFQPEKLKLFEDYRDKYVGKDGIVFAKRPRQVSR